MTAESAEIRDEFLLIGTYFKNFSRKSNNNTKKNADDNNDSDDSDSDDKKPDDLKPVLEMIPVVKENGIVKAKKSLKGEF